MIHIWKLPILQEIRTLSNDPPELKNSIVYDGLGFCKLSCDKNEGNEIDEIIKFQN